MTFSNSPDQKFFNEQNHFIISQIIQKRKAQSITQAELAAAIEISEEEYASYENGINHMSASVLFLVSTILDGNPLSLLEEVAQISDFKVVNKNSARLAVI
jgi:transcriptional regulator with XRE-family HTH domain